MLPAEERGASYAPEALELLLPEIGGYPYFVQLVGYEAWQVASSAGKKRIDGDVARAAAAAARRQARALYDSRLEEVPDAERRFLEAAAALPEEERTTAAVAARLGGASEGWGWARRRLTDRGLVRTGFRGRIVLALPGLGQHLRER